MAYIGKTAIKATLPDVKLSYCGRVYVGQLSGRERPFASVTIRSQTGAFLTWDYSWDTIARAVNNQTALTV